MNAESRLPIEGELRYPEPLVDGAPGCRVGMRFVKKSAMTAMMARSASADRKPCHPSLLVHIEEHCSIDGHTQDILDPFIRELIERNL